jgi:hypothetical protein
MHGPCKQVVEGDSDAAKRLTFRPAMTASARTRPSQPEMNFQGGEKRNEDKGKDRIIPATDQEQRCRHWRAGTDNLRQNQEVIGEITP